MFGDETDVFLVQRSASYNDERLFVFFASRFWSPPLRRIRILLTLTTGHCHHEAITEELSSLRASHPGHVMLPGEGVVPAECSVAERNCRHHRNEPAINLADDV